MSLYVSEKVGNEIVLKKYAPAVPVYRGFWAIVIVGFAGTLVECNGSMRYIGSNEKTIYQIVEPGTYTFTATRHGETKSKTIVLDDEDPNNSYTVNLGLYIGMEYLEYIESTGTQYIDTGIIPSTNNYIVHTVLSPTVVSTNVLVGVANSTWGYPGLLINDQGTFRYGNQAVQTISPVFVENNKYTLTLSVKKLVVNGITYTTTNPSYEGNIEYSIYLFARNNGIDGVGNLASMKLYSCKIYDGETLVRDFIPIKDDTNHGALYDKVTQQIFYNSGTGEFVCGPNLYTRIQYLESTGTQWIDTEYVLTSDNVWYLSKFALKSKNSAVFGSQNPSKSGARFSGIHYFRDNGTLYSATGTSDGLCAQPYVANTVCEIDTVINQGQIQKTQNGVTVSASYAGSVQTGLPIALFGDRFQDGIRETGSGARMYYFKMYENNTLVRDFIPVLDPNRVPCMFDQVEGKFYYNAGTGQFIAGPEEQ